MYLHVFCRHIRFKDMQIRICIERLLHVTVGMRAVAARFPRCRCGKFVARAVQAQANDQQIYLDQVRSTGQRQDAGSQSLRQLEQ